jgi:hypothetical protein
MPVTGSMLHRTEASANHPESTRMTGAAVDVKRGRGNPFHSDPANSRLRRFGRRQTDPRAADVVAHDPVSGATDTDRRSKECIRWSSIATSRLAAVTAAVSLSSCGARLGPGMCLRSTAQNHHGHAPLRTARTGTCGMRQSQYPANPPVRVTAAVVVQSLRPARNVKTAWRHGRDPPLGSSIAARGRHGTGNTRFAQPATR